MARARISPRAASRTSIRHALAATVFAAVFASVSTPIAHAQPAANPGQARAVANPDEAAAAVNPDQAAAAANPDQAAGSANPDEDFHVYNDSPRLFLTKTRLRRLQRERERQSPRWQQFDALISGGTPLPEPAFAWALYFQITGDKSYARKAVEWALDDHADPPRDLRQLAIIYDWCASAVSAADAGKLAKKIERGMGAPNPSGGPAAIAQKNDDSGDVQRVSARALATIAIADTLPDHGAAILSNIVNSSWRGISIKRIEKGTPIAPREQLYALYEMMHAIRDNLKIDLRDSAPAYFHTLPLDHLAGHYPAPLQEPENDYHVPVYVREGNPDVAEATMSRAAELAMVAYDENALESQYLQGWLMQDRFMMRGALGTAYEFLWADPYQPGLSYSHLPPVFHDPVTGHVFARSSWDEDATWLGYFDGHLQVFRDGQIETLRPGAAIKPLNLGDAFLLSANDAKSANFRASAKTVFVLKLEPLADYDVEVDDEELSDGETDSGGTLVLTFPQGADRGIRIRRHVIAPADSKPAGN